MRISDWSSDVCSSDLPEIFVFLVGGAAIVLIFGTIPGLQNVTALAILLPFTYALAPAQAFAMMVAIYAAGVYGGSITAILYRIPGAPENAEIGRAHV